MSLKFCTWGESHTHLPIVLALPTSAGLVLNIAGTRESWGRSPEIAYIFSPTIEQQLCCPPSSPFLPVFDFLSHTIFLPLSSYYLCLPHWSSLLLLPLLLKSHGFVTSSLQSPLPQPYCVVKRPFHNPVKATCRITATLKQDHSCYLCFKRFKCSLFVGSEEGVNLWYSLHFWLSIYLIV